MPEHDFKRFPELTNAQLDVLYFVSPHRQITEDFRAKVVKVTDGDTVRLRWSERTFDFPLRFMNIAAPELKEQGGEESKAWLENKILNKEVDIIMTQGLRVDKWGRLLGNVVFRGVDMGEESIFAGHSLPWEQRDEGSIPDFDKEMEQWL